MRCAENEGAGKRGRARWLTAAAACAALEGAYYFIEQGVWLSKAGGGDATTIDA